jgi:tRNA pseudouridine13 synthase
MPGTGGELVASPEHFVVEELSLYEPCGAGEHVHLTIRREGWTTRDVQRALAAAFDLRERDVGCAGQKDKAARATQAFSLPIPAGSAEEIAARAAAATGFEVLSAGRHVNKLRRGHLAGNRFAILLAGVGAGALERARGIAARLADLGAPNFFGPQRLGPGGRNARRGRKRLGERAGSWIARMELSAWQSELFNTWLAERMRRFGLDAILVGDVARKEATGGLFEVEDTAAERPRAARREISATGPIYGSRMRWATGDPGDLERDILAASGIETAALARSRLPGSRRPARVFPSELAIEPAAEGLRLRFRLPKGAFATVVAREFTKPSGPGAEDYRSLLSGSSHTTSPGNPDAAGSQETGE